MLQTLIPWLLIFSSACSTKKWALRSATPLFHDSSTLSTRENNWDYFKESTPANLKFTELLSLQDQDNTDLLALLVKGHAGYAYAVPETLFFQDELAGKENSPWKKQAIYHYTRALDYGVVYLGKMGITSKDLLERSDEELAKKLKAKIEKDDLTGLLYTAQAWGSLINLQKDNVALISQVSKVKVMFDHVCRLNPKIDEGVCDIFNAQYEASRPRMLGGNPEKARALYAEAFKKYPKHLLMRLSFIQFLLIPAMEGEAYEQEAKILRAELAKWENLNRDSLEDKSEYRHARHLDLYNAIAKKRFEAIEKYKSKIF